MKNSPEPTEPIDRDELDIIAEEYSARCRAGGSPSIEEYAERFPELAAEIRQLLPAVAFLEKGKRSTPMPSAPHRSGSRPSLLAGALAPGLAQLGENRIIRELGRGGMGIVYEAVQEPLGRKVAVKVLPRHSHADETNRQRFLREARVIAKLQHPNIVPIHLIGEQDGLPYYVMPVIDGFGLDRLAPGDPNGPPAEVRARARWVAEIGRQAAIALAYAHSQQILHRDIKPANLLLDSGGIVWLADFGLAKLVDDLSLTGSGDLPGTLRYLAPECLNSEATEQSDIYSLGITLYELCLGQPAFTETDRIRLLRQVEAQQVPPPRERLPELPRDLETIILKAISPDPAGRYATADAMANDLDRFLNGLPPLARRTTAPEGFVRWCRRNPVVAALSATSIVFGVLAVIFIRFWFLAPPFPRDGMRPPDELDRAFDRGEMEPPPDGGPRGEPNGRRRPPPPFRKGRP